ncbi:MAG: hypothetical protein ACHP9T_12865 [Caulobacterales bacterium]|jgi:hypothetical protein
MRLRTVVALAIVLSAPGLALAPRLALAQQTVDPAPMTWRGVQLGGEQVFEGDYTVNFETSVFRPDGAPASDALWLSAWEDRLGDNGGFMRRYHLRFVGRQTVQPGWYGSLGAYKNSVLITRLVSARLLIGN